MLISLHVSSYLILTVLWGCEYSLFCCEDFESLEEVSLLPKVTTSIGSSQNSDPGLADSKAHILSHINALLSMK